MTVSAHWRRVDIHSEKFAIWAREGLITRLRDGPRKSRPYGSLFGGVLAQHIASVDPYINGLLTPTSTVCWLLRQLAARYQAGKGKLRFLCPACLTFSSPCRLPSVVSLLDLGRLLGEWGGRGAVVVCALAPLARYNSRTCTNPRLALLCAEFHLRCGFLLAGPPPLVSRRASRAPTVVARRGRSRSTVKWYELTPSLLHLFRFPGSLGGGPFYGK